MKKRVLGSGGEDVQPIRSTYGSVKGVLGKDPKIAVTGPMRADIGKCIFQVVLLELEATVFDEMLLGALRQILHVVQPISAKKYAAYNGIQMLLVFQAIDSGTRSVLGSLDLVHLPVDYGRKSILGFVSQLISTRRGCLILTGILRWVSILTASLRVDGVMFLGTKIIRYIQVFSEVRGFGGCMRGPPWLGLCRFRVLQSKKLGYANLGRFWFFYAAVVGFACRQGCRVLRGSQAYHCSPLCVQVWTGFFPIRSASDL